MPQLDKKWYDHDHLRGDDHEDPTPQNPISIHSVHTVRHFELPARYTYNPGDIHDQYELLYVEKGVFLDKSEDKTVTMRAGDAVIFGPNYFHKTNCDGEHSASIFVTSFLCDSELLREFFPDNSRTFVRITPEQRSILGLAFAAGVKAYDTNGHFCKSKETAPHINRQVFINYIEILFLQIIDSLREEKAKEKIFFAHDGKDSDLTTKIIAYLESKLYSDVTIEEICAHVGYSRGHVCSHFKKATGKTVNTYYQFLKIEEAKRLILETNQDFAAISDMLGFSNPQYFNKVFRRLTGHTPGHFRKTIFKGSLEK